MWRKFLVAVAAVAMVVPALQVEPAAAVRAEALRHQSLTPPPGAEGFEFTVTDGRIDVSGAADLTDPGVREVFWDGDDAPSIDQEVCVTWETTPASVPGSLLQPGVALRVAPVDGQTGAYRAITITENVWDAGFWLFNIHVFDTTQTEPFTILATFDLSSIVGRVVGTGPDAVSSMVPPPWHLCARAIGDEASFMVWTAAEPMPSWEDPTHTFAATLPPGWDSAGRAGGYIGHLQAGERASFSGLTYQSLDQTPEEKYVIAMYDEFLGRDPNPSDLADWSSGLEQGTKTRSDLVTSLAVSPEWTSHLVDRYYRDTLGRAPEQEGLAYWVGVLGSKQLSVAQVAAAFYASPEYWSGFGASDDATWVADLYRKLLQREPDQAGLGYWVGLTRTAGRNTVAYSFYQSPESRRNRVADLYEDLLDREPDAGGLAYWASRVATGGDLALAANLAASDESFAHAQGDVTD